MSENIDLLLNFSLCDNSCFIQSIIMGFLQAKLCVYNHKTTWFPWKVIQWVNCIFLH